MDPGAVGYKWYDLAEGLAYANCVCRTMTTWFCRSVVVFVIVA